MAEIRKLLESVATGTPTPDSAELWRRGRRRRRRVRMATGSALVLVVVVALVGIDPAPRQVVVEPAESPTAVPTSTAPSAAPPGTPSPAPAGEASSATPSPPPASEVLVAAGPVAGPATGATVGGLSVTDDGTVRLVRVDAAGQGRAFTVGTEDSSGTLTAGVAVDPAGSIGFQVHRDDATFVYRLDPEATTPALVTGALPPAQLRLVGAGEVDGVPVLLAAEGQATSLVADAGMDLVAYTGTGERRVLVEDAAAAWESGVVAADVAGGWVVWERFDSTVGTVLAAPIAEPDEVVQVLRVDTEDAGVDPAGVALADAGGSPVVGVLLHHRAGFPDEPGGELVTFVLPGLEERRYQLDGISWAEGMPWALDRLGPEWLISRMGEGFSPRPALVGTPGRWRDLAIDGIVGAGAGADGG